MKKLDSKRCKLFDGIESNLYEKVFVLEVEGKQVKFIVDDITPNKLISLTEKTQIITEANFGSRNDTFFTSEDRLQVYYLKSKTFILIFSFGEFQPARYKLYLESVYRL